MKNVAANSGQSVSLAIRFFPWGIAEGSRAGSDNVLNFYSRSSSGEMPLSPNIIEPTGTASQGFHRPARHGGGFVIGEYRVRPGMQQENAPSIKFFRRLRSLPY